MHNLLELILYKVLVFVKHSYGTIEEHFYLPCFKYTIRKTRLILPALFLPKKLAVKMDDFNTTISFQKIFQTL